MSDFGGTDRTVGTVLMSMYSVLRTPYLHLATPASGQSQGYSLAPFIALQGNLTTQGAEFRLRRLR